jgi:hypothetical protein
MPNPRQLSKRLASLSEPWVFDSYSKAMHHQTLSKYSITPFSNAKPKKILQSSQLNFQTQRFFCVSQSHAPPNLNKTFNSFIF